MNGKWTIWGFLPAWFKVLWIENLPSTLSNSDYNGFTPTNTELRCLRRTQLFTNQWEKEVHYNHQNVENCVTPNIKT